MSDFCLAKTVERKTKIGTLLLVEENRTSDPGEPPPLHIANEWTKLHLRWIALSGDMTIDLEDDGHMLQIVVDGHDCIGSAPFQRYRQREGEPEIWAEMHSSLLAVLKACPRIGADQAAIYIRGLREAGADFAVGVEALKHLARQTFRNTLARCRPRRNPVVLGPFDDRCDGVW
jgi:hypothetical protein